MKLSEFKAAAAAQLANAHSTVQTYVSELEASVKSARPILIVVAVFCFIAGAYIGHLFHK